MNERKTLMEVLDQVKGHPEYARAGMVLCHNGIVRESSRDGRMVDGLRIAVDYDVLGAIMDRARAMPGIVDARVWIDDTRDLAIGDDVMFLVVAGDIREHVLACLTDTLNAIKSQATKKTEFFA